MRIIYKIGVLGLIFTLSVGAMGNRLASRLVAQRSQAQVPAGSQAQVPTGSQAQVPTGSQGQDVQMLLAGARAKIAQVNDYVANARLKIDVSFLKAPESAVRVFFKKPDQFRVRKEGGISILPKGGLSISLNTLLKEGSFAAVDAGIEPGDQPLRIIKLVPLKDAGDIVLTTLYIEEKTLLVRKAITSTRSNGTFELDLYYGRYAAFALPDKAIFIFNTEGYKLPKGLSLDYDPKGTGANATPPPGEARGQVTLTYSDYTINKGVPADAFQ